MIMSKGISRGIAVLLGGGAFAIGAVPATAASSNHTGGGVPGAKNCHGQAIASFAQTFGPGLGPAARSEGFTVKEVQTFFREICAL
jgi:hypothetical protein